MNKPLFLLILLVSLSLVACDNAPKAKQALIQQTVDKYTQATTLDGIVSNDRQPISVGTVKATTETGRIIVETALHNGNHYRVEIPAQTTLPIILTFQSSDSSQSSLISVVAHGSLSHYDINPLTTRIAKIAMTMGGYTRANLRRAAEDSVHVPDTNKTSSGFRGDPTTQYGGWH